MESIEERHQTIQNLLIFKHRITKSRIFEQRPWIWWAEESTDYTMLSTQTNLNNFLFKFKRIEKNCLHF